MTPLIERQTLDPNLEDTKPMQIHEYQSKVGSIVYPTYITHLDAAFAAQKLSEHLRNPSQRHLDAADRTIKYMDGTYMLAIEYLINKINKSFIFVTDVAFIDNLDRKSSKGFVFKIFGRVVDWKASKQKIVIISTTEAKLLLLSNRAQEVY